MYEAPRACSQYCGITVEGHWSQLLDYAAYKVWRAGERFSPPPQSYVEKLKNPVCNSTAKWRLLPFTNTTFTTSILTCQHVFTIGYTHLQTACTSETSPHNLRGLQWIDCLLLPGAEHLRPTGVNCNMWSEAPQSSYHLVGNLGEHLIWQNGSQLALVKFKFGHLNA